MAAPIITILCLLFLLSRSFRTLGAGLYFKTTIAGRKRDLRRCGDPILTSILDHLQRSLIGVHEVQHHKKMRVFWHSQRGLFPQKKITGGRVKLNKTINLINFITDF